MIESVYMSKAYGLLGVLMLVVLAGALFAFKRAEAPTENGMLPDNTSMSMSLSLTSPAFDNNGSIPSKYTCDGANVSPELRIDGVPDGADSLVLVMDDPDIPDSVKESRGIEKFDHWAMYSIPADTAVIPEGTSIGAEGVNGAGNTGYTGPCPPPEYEPTEHRYIFRLYAISGTLNFIKAPTLDELETAAKGMALDSATLIGRYERQ